MCDNYFFCKKILREQRDDQSENIFDKIKKPHR
jgi:hypothetical protein